MKAKLLNTVATLLTLALVLVALPLSLPRLFGYNVYHVLTSSMVPALPVGGAIYVAPCQPQELQIGDIITFRVGVDHLVETHRVVQNDFAAKQLVTKGDANSQPDVDPVEYQCVVGKVIFCLPHLGAVAQWIQSRAGMLTCVCIFALAALLWAMADKCKERENCK